MFNKLSSNFSGVLNKIRNRGHLSQDDIDKAMREMRIALLEADVSLQVVKDFIEQVKIKASGAELSKNVMPGQVVIKIVHDELTQILGGKNSTLDKEIGQINLRTKSPAIIMLVGLQGTGKTTTAAKLALWLQKKHQKKILLASTDIYRPAAQLQLEKLAHQINAQSLPIIEGERPEIICIRAIEIAKKDSYDVLIIDTAGRLQTNSELMKELRMIKEKTSPSEIILTTDAMIGQESANIAKEFHEQLNLTSIILTKVDGDSRGGAALSMKMITGRPIKFTGVGEKLEAFEVFHPERAASQILGMGDIVSLVEKATEMISKQEAEMMAKKLQQGQFDMDDLLKQMQNIKKMGSITSILGMIPGLGKIKNITQNKQDDGALKNLEAIIRSMTKKERKNPLIINNSRKRRISAGSGKSIEEINKLLKQFKQMKLMMKQMNKINLFSNNGKRNISPNILKNIIR